MLRRSVKIQLVLFVIITLAGVSYVSATYVGLFNGLFSGAHPCTVAADFSDSGGIFTNAEVTYRGVAIGRVGSLDLTPTGVKVDLVLDDCRSAQVPADTAAAVSDRSVIGEQYVNLVPPSAHGPYLTGGEVIPQSRTSIPTAPETLLRNLDGFVTSVNTQNLATVIGELGKAFSNRGPALGRLLDANRELLATAQANVPNTTALIDQSATVLQTQLDEQAPLAGWAHSLNLLSAQLKKSDPDLRRLFNDGPSSLSTIRSLVTDNRTDLGVLLANVATTNTTIVRHIDGVEEILELLPALAAGGDTVVRSNGVAGLGLVTNINDPKDCGDPNQGGQGYGGTVHRSPDVVTPIAPNTHAQCTAPVSSGTDVRGSQNVPNPEPLSYAGATVAYPRGTTAAVQAAGRAPQPTYGTLDGAGALGDGSWQAILTAGLH